MTGPGLDSLPDHARKTLADLDRKDETNRAQIKNLQKEIRNRSETKIKVINEYIPDYQGPPTQAISRPSQDPTGCPLTQEQMRQLGNRRDIIIAIALASPDKTVKPSLATKWMSDAAIFNTPPDNAAKSLSRYMRRHPEIWEPLQRGWFRFVGTPDQYTGLPATITQTDPAETFTDTEESQEEPTGSAQHQPENSQSDDSPPLS